MTTDQHPRQHDSQSGLFDVEELRNLADVKHRSREEINTALLHSADEIDRLRTEVSRLRTEIKRAADLLGATLYDR